MVTIENGEVRDSPVRGTAESRKADVMPPRTWVRAVELLGTAHRQAGLLYAILPADFDKPVGPFELGETLSADTVARRVAEATGTRLQWIGDVAVFDPPEIELPARGRDAEPMSPWEELRALDMQGDSGAVVRLTELAGSGDGAIRFHAVAALQRMEGDFMRSTYPGRVSILEVLSDKIDHNGLLTGMQEGGAEGGRAWKLALELLGRARTRVLARSVWNAVWQKHAGVMEIGLWALGRCGDASGAWAMRSRVRNTFSNDPAHRYLAAMAQGQLNGLRYLKRDVDSSDVEVRRATAFGLGFVEPGNERARRYLFGYLDDPDAAVRFVACQSLARMGDLESLDKLASTCGDGSAFVGLRASAMDALVAMGRPQAGDILVAAALDENPTIRAQSAFLLGEHGGPRARTLLAQLILDESHRVRCAAICSLAQLGTDEAIARAGAALSDSRANADEKISALLGLGRSLAPAAAEVLGSVASDTTVHARLRRYAILGLTRLANRAGHKRVAELADPSSDAHLPYAIRYLDLETPAATAAFLIPLLTHSSRDGACAAAGRLAELGFGPATVELLEGSDILDNHTRMMHMWGCVRSPGREVALALVEAARNPRRSIRATAALGLGGRFYPEVVDALIELSQDESSGVRKQAAQSLGVTPDPRAAQALIAMVLNDKNERVAIEAGRALRLRDYRSLPAVREVFKKLAGTPRDPGGINPERPGLAAQGEHSFVLRTWADHVEEDLVCSLTYESSVCYDARRGRVVQWGAHGRRYDTPQTGQTWFYTAADNRWKRLVDSRHWPNGTCCIRGTMYDDANQVVISPRSASSGGHGWKNALRINLTHSSPWVLDVRTDQWYAASPLTSGSAGFQPGSHDPVHGVTLWWKGRLQAYDVYANEWFRFRPKGAAARCPGDSGGVFDPQTGRFIAVGSNSTWAFDPAANQWTDLKTEGPKPPACPMVYDSANDVMLSFQAQGGDVAVWVLHLRANKWERLPAVHPCPAHRKIWDAAYDRKNNVAVITGTSAGGFSAGLNVRETWTYRYRPAAARDPGMASPRDVRCVTGAGGKVTLTWRADPRVKNGKYRIERAVAARPWEGKWEKAGEVDGGKLVFEEVRKDVRHTFYRVIAVDAGGKESRPGFPARTSPPIVRQVTAVVRPKGGVRVRWEPPVKEGVAGYHVYRAPVDLGSPWGDRFSPAGVADTLERITKEPVPATELVDQDAKVNGPADALTWPKTYAYVVRAVNAWGHESGPSPVTLALPDPPGPVRAIPWADGCRLVLWDTCKSGGIAGYHLMRMDDWHAKYVFRLQASPLLFPAFRDSENHPTVDRRRYYASGVDALGTIGLPTSGAWSHGYP